MISRSGQLERLRPFFAPAISLALIALAGFVIHRITEDIRVAEIRAAVQAIPLFNVGLAIIFTAMSFSALAILDVLAVRSVAPGAVSDRRAAIAGALGYAISNVLGFGVVTGGALRYRIYSAEGLDAADVLRVTTTSYLAFWFGITTLLGLALIIDPVDLGMATLIGVPAETALGVALLGLVGGALIWTGRASQHLSFRGWSIPIPTPAIAAGQIAAGSFDIAVSAAVLYVLLPAEARPGLPYFLAIYVGALSLGTLSHAPGGLGVFEATIIAATGHDHSADVIAALVLYRLVYYALPFIIGLVGLAAFEVARQRHFLTAAAADTERILRPIVPHAAAAIAFVAGLVLLFSGSLPGTASRLQSLHRAVGLPLIETSHLIGSVVGVSLLILARGLLRRLHAAWLASMALLIAGIVASLTRGIAIEEATFLALMAALLFALRPAFYRSSDLSWVSPSPRWLATVVAGVVAAVWLGFFSYRHVYYGNELWWQFAIHGNAPRFLRATVAVAVILIWSAVASLVHRRPPKFKPDLVDDVVRRLVSSSPRSQANVAFLGDKKFIVAPDQSAFLMYGVFGRSWISMGDPVGDPAAASDLIWRLRELADQAGGRAVYYAVGPTNLPTYLDMGFSVLKVAEVARVDLTEFSLTGKKAQDFRYADRRAQKEGICFEIIPKCEVEKHIDQLRIVSDAWLAHKSGSEKGFSLGAFSPAYLSEFDCAVMRDDSGILAFTNIWRGADKEEMSVDMMRYLPHRSGILMDAMFARLLLYAKEDGYRWFNLGAAPLSGLKDHPLASTWNKVGNLLYRHAENFYHFEGLKSFKQKFNPVWNPQYVCTRGGFALPTVLLDITALISGGRLGVLVR
jgi:phosphatidylglycerol lysyltransferase